MIVLLTFHLGGSDWMTIVQHNVLGLSQLLFLRDRTILGFVSDNQMDGVIMEIFIGHASIPKFFINAG